MKLGKIIIILSILCVMFLGFVFTIIVSLQEHENISKGTIFYHLLVDDRFKKIEIDSNYDFKYIPADGTSPEIHTLKLYIKQNPENEIKMVSEYFKGLGFREVNGNLRQGHEVLSVEKDLDTNIVLFSLYIY